MRGRLTPPKEPRASLGASPFEDLDAELDAAFASLEVVEELMRSRPKCDAIITIRGRQVFLVKTSRIRE